MNKINTLEVKIYQSYGFKSIQELDRLSEIELIRLDLHDAILEEEALEDLEVF
jgi:hypothetical protein